MAYSNPTGSTRARGPALARLLLGAVLLAPLSACQKKEEEAPPPAVAPLEVDSRHLYVSTGACYSGGGNTTFTNLTASNLVYRLSLENGRRDDVIADYFASPSSSGDSPVAVVPNGSGHLFVLIENATTASLRRIEKVEIKNHGSRSTFSNNTAALSAPLRSLTGYAAGGLLVTKTTGIEFINGSGARIGSPYINPTVAPCATTNTGLTRVLPLREGKFAVLHAAAGQNRIAMIGPTGGTGCLASQPAPAAAAFPTAGFYDIENQKLIVAYAGGSIASDINSIYAYSVDETAGTISAPQKLYDASGYPALYPYLLYGISEMIYDPKTKSVFVATAISTATTVANYAIEKLRYAPENIGVTNSLVLERVGDAPFYEYGSDTKCVSQMIIGD